MWHEDLVELDSDVLLVRSADIKIYVEYVNAGLIEPAHEIYKVVPNGVNYIDLMSCYLQCTNSEYKEYTVTHSAMSGDGYEYFQLWKYLVLSLSSWDAYSSDVLIKLLKNHRFQGLKNTSSLLEFAEATLNGLIKPLINSSPFASLICRDDNKDWWNSRVPLVDSIEKLNVLLDKELFGRCYNVGEAKSSINKLNKLFGRLTGLSLAQSLFLLSAYCFAIAKTNIRNNIVARTFVLLHRSIDLYFQSLCANNNLLIIEGERLAYRGSSEMVTLMNSEYLLIQTSSINRDRTRHERLKWINTQRNSNILAHGAYDLSDDDQVKCMQYIEDMIRVIEGNNRWHLSCEEFVPQGIMYDRWLFDIESDFDTYITSFSFSQ